MADAIDFSNPIVAAGIGLLSSNNPQDAMKITTGLLSQAKQEQRQAKLDGLLMRKTEAELKKIENDPYYGMSEREEKIQDVMQTFGTDRRGAMQAIMFNKPVTDPLTGRTSVVDIGPSVGISFRPTLGGSPAPETGGELTGDILPNGELDGYDPLLQAGDVISVPGKTPATDQRTVFEGLEDATGIDSSVASFGNTLTGPFGEVDKGVEAARTDLRLLGNAIKKIAAVNPDRPLKIEMEELAKIVPSPSAFNSSPEAAAVLEKIHSRLTEKMNHEWSVANDESVAPITRRDAQKAAMDIRYLLNQLGDPSQYQASPSGGTASGGQKTPSGGRLIFNPATGLLESK